MIFTLAEGGNSIIFSYVGIVLFLPVLSKLFKIRLWLHYCDIIWPGLICWQALGKIGCFFQGCCYGTKCDLPWAVRHINQSNNIEMIHPVQIYESVSLFIIFFALIKIKKNNIEPGIIFYSSIIFYCIVRFIFEFFRGDSIYYFSVFSVSQLISIIIVIISSFSLIKLKINPQKYHT